jgi:hypothetical protein
MSRPSMAYAVLAAAGILAFSSAPGARAQEAFSVDLESLDANGCLGATSCELDAAIVVAAGGVIAKKSLNGESGFGVSGGPSGNEIDLGQAVEVKFDEPRRVVAIKFLFLYNGPEFGDRAEIATVKADGTTYTLATRNDADDATADWSGPGTVSQCGATTAAGTGCFIVTDPFAGAVGRLKFSAAPGGQPFPVYGGAGSSESDYSIGFIDVASNAVIDLADCADEKGCTVAKAGGSVAFSLSSMEVENPGGSTQAAVIPVRLPDCRYIPQACIDLLPPAGDSAADDDAARALLISLGVIKPRAPSGPYKLAPATQLLNVTPLLPPEVTALFDGSGEPPEGLPPLYIGDRWRGQAGNDHWFDGFFFRTDDGIQFRETFDGLIDVSLLTGDELGCFANPADLLAWDAITAASELALSVGGRHVDKLINVGCENPTKVSGDRLSLYSINLEVVPDTFGPTIKSGKPKLTLDNDAVFARLVQTLWKDLGETKARYACRQADPAPSGGTAPLSKPVCKQLASLWTGARNRINQCVKTTFKPAGAQQAKACARAIDGVVAFEAALPASPTGPDPFNRLGELKTRVTVFRHVWDERFLQSIKPGGFCREKGTCPP